MTHTTKFTVDQIANQVRILTESYPEDPGVKEFTEAAKAADQARAMEEWALTLAEQADQLVNRADFLSDEAVRAAFQADEGFSNSRFAMSEKAFALLQSL